MPTTLTYGLAETYSLENAEVAHLRSGESQPLPTEQIAEQVKSQLAAPLNYPSLSQAIIPGDQIVVAVEPGVPQQIHVIEGALQALALAGTDAQQITLLLTGSPASVKALESELAGRGHSNYQFELHDPENEKEIAFLGVSETGLAMRLNRRLCDADFVLPISAAVCNVMAADEPNYCLGPFPTFSDRETLERLANSGAENFPATSQENSAECQDCARQLGTQFHLQIVPHGNGQVADVVAGESSAVLRQSESSYRALWEREAPVLGKLVIATITGDEKQQTWHNLGRAIAAAERVLEPDGSIVICSEITEPPGEALGQLVGNDDPMLIEREIQKTQSVDSGPAMVLNRALQRGSVYLRSRLRPALVESLGITPLESDSELERLTQSLRPCVALEEAQYLLPMVAEHEADE